MLDRENKIIFVGTGGGGSMVGLQALSTGGMWWKLNGVDFYVDPGPGTVWHLRQSLKKWQLPVGQLRFIFVSHHHADHVNDLNPLIEGIHYDQFHLRSQQSRKDIIEPEPKLTLLAPAQVIGTKERPGLVSAYHHHLLLKAETLKPQSSYQFDRLELTTTKRLPEKPYYQGKVEEYGFCVKSAETTIGYLPETYWSEGLFSEFHPRILVYNLMIWIRDNDRQAMIKTIKEIKPDLVILRHWTRRSIKFGIDRIAKEFQKETKVSVLAARDFTIFDLGKRKFLEQTNN